MLVTRWVYLRLLGFVWLAAFLSLWVQVGGLYGGGGVLPMAELLDAHRAALEQAGGPGAILYWLRVPTLFWLGASDLALAAACAAGCIAAAAVIANVLPGPALAACWVLYLSFVAPDVAFLTFQWDLLLLEAGLLALLIVPWELRPGFGEGEPPRLGVWLHRWLLARLIFWSGVAKLASGDPTWRDLSALSYHYWTQPLPSPLAWYAHQLPGWFHTASGAVMFAIELGAPLLMLLPLARARAVAAAAVAGLMGLIALTGNYGFFNLLTASLCVLLLEDAVWVRWLPARHRPPRYDTRPPPLAAELLLMPFAALVLLSGAVHLALRFGDRGDVPAPVLALLQWTGGFRSINHYGLFAVMTTSRPELELLGSVDGETWRSYPFRWKPGEVGEPPPLIPLHMPRLDWRMWFAALGEYQPGTWFDPFARRVLEGSPQVLGLLGPDPLKGYPPKYLRAMRYQYRFTTPAERAETGDWWVREPAGAWSPMFSRE